MADVKWIKLSTGLPDNRKIKQIRTLPDGDTIALMWIFLMCLAGNSNDDGFVFFTKEIPYTDEMLAEEFKMDINTIRLGLATFEKFGMIEIVDDFICLSAWEKWQSIINGRYVDKKTTIFTSNYPISQLKYDDRITNRILERSLEIPFPEESVREHIADAMKQELIKKIQGGENGKQA